MLDIFKQDAFSVIALTDALNKMPFAPGRAGTVAGWNEQGVSTLSVAIEEIGGMLELVNPSPRGGVGSTFPPEKRKLRMLAIPHYEIIDGIIADQVQGVRAFGSETQLMTVQALVNARMRQHTQLRLDPTLEYQRIGALKGLIKNGDGTTLYDLFDEFEVTPVTEVDFNLDATTITGAVRIVCTGVKRQMSKVLGGIPFSGVYALCGDDFWDALISNAEVRQTYLNWTAAAQLRTGYNWGDQFSYGGIIFENYRGSVGSEEAGGAEGEAGTPFVETDKCHMFPVGVPGLFRTIYAPADYTETVNTMGLPRYSRQWEMENGKGINLSIQMNALNFCTRPRVLIQGRI